MRLFILKMIILPRQARDKHRESTQNSDAFSLGHSVHRSQRGGDGSGAACRVPYVYCQVVPAVGDAAPGCDGDAVHHRHPQGARRARYVRTQLHIITMHMIGTRICLDYCV